jgi:hypothetical protein
MTVEAIPNSSRRYPRAYSNAVRSPQSIRAPAGGRYDKLFGSDARMAHVSETTARK